jgi:hypothetical protein
MLRLIRRSILRSPGQRVEGRTARDVDAQERVCSRAGSEPSGGTHTIALYEKLPAVKGVLTTP